MKIIDTPLVDIEPTTVTFIYNIVQIYCIFNMLNYNNKTVLPSFKASVMFQYPENR